MPNKVWDELTDPFPNFNSATVEVWEWMSNFISHFIIDVITYPCLGQQKVIWNINDDKTLPKDLCDFAGIILCMRPAYESLRYNVMSSLIGRAHSQKLSLTL